MYKIRFEVVTPIGQGARYYRNEKPACHPSQVPDKVWTQVVRVTDDPWDQYNTLKEWAASDEHFIRSVKLFEASDPTWEEVEGNG